jgi:hypothetical protein
MLEILTPIYKVHRVSRSVNPATFVAVPGIWAVLNSDGSLKNVVTSSPDKTNKLVINSASSNPYESNDVEVGRVSTVEDIGIRCLVDGAGFTGNPAVGDLLAVSTPLGYEGKLFSTTENPWGESGDFQIVARVEEVDAVAGTIVFRTISPSIVTL